MSLLRQVGAKARRWIRPRMAANSCLGMATSASWKITYRKCRTTFAPVFTSFSRSVVSDQCRMLLGDATYASHESVYGSGLIE